MNDALRELEARLAALRPRQPAEALRERIAQTLHAEARTAATRRRLVVAALASLAVATMVALAGLVWLRAPATAPPPPVAAMAAATTAPAERVAPTMWNYRQAALRSHEELDAMLEREARVPLGTVELCYSALLVREHAFN